MAELFWKTGTWDYANEAFLMIRVRKTEHGDLLPSDRDMLDILINKVVPEIRRGKRSNENWEKLGVQNGKMGSM